MATFFNLPQGQAVANALTAQIFNLTTTPGNFIPGLDIALLVDGSGDEFLLGSFQNVVFAGVGNDTINGNAGMDILNGGLGEDRVFGGFGADSLSGGAGADTIKGSTDLGGASAGDDDTISGGGGKDVLFGHEGDDLLKGGHGGDFLSGGIGNDTMYGATNVDIMFGGDGNDRMLGGEDGDVLTGEDGNDTIFGGLGADNLRGGNGEDTLSGGAGTDGYVFDTALNATSNVDTIYSYRSVDDYFSLSRAIFDTIGTMTRDAFFVGDVANDAQDRIIYDREAGVLYYDEDGNGPAFDIAFAIVSGSRVLTYQDFFLFSP